MFHGFVSATFSSAVLVFGIFFFSGIISSSEEINSSFWRNIALLTNSIIPPSVIGVPFSCDPALVPASLLSATKYGDGLG
jgi:hypothetical protein